MEGPFKASGTASYSFVRGTQGTAYGLNDRDSIKVTAQPGKKDKPRNKGEFNYLTPF